MLSFADAMLAAHAAFAPPGATPASFAVSAVGFEDETHYLVNVGPPEVAIDGMDGYIDNIARFIDKRTGEATTSPITSVFDKLDRMTEVTV